jgi:Holliday junction resolvasome RuvABC endonuclease subunit
VKTVTGRYRAGFVIVEDGVLVAQSSYTAPVGEGEPRQLGELVVHAAQVLDEYTPELVALRQTELGGPRAPKMGPLAVTLHAEGAILAVVGERRIEAIGLARATLSALLAGSAKLGNDEIVERLTTGLTGKAPQPETAVAAATAVAAIMQRS